MGKVRPFTSKSVQLQKGDVILLFTDGFADQFGGAAGKKFMYRALKKLFLSVAGLPVSEISGALNSAFHDWRGDFDQVDDVLVFGLKV